MTTMQTRSTFHLVTSAMKYSDCPIVHKPFVSTASGRACLLFISLGWATASHPVADAEVLPSIPDRMCTADTTIQSAGPILAEAAGNFQAGLKNRTARHVNLSCFSGGSDASLKVAGTQPLIVDLRTARQFERMHSTNSINLQAHVLAIKSFLKLTPIRLLDDGHNAAELQSVCEMLKSKGFVDVSAIGVGITHWLGRNPNRAIDPAAFAESTRLTASELIPQKNDDHVLIIDVSGTRVLSDLAPKGNVLKIDPKDKRAPQKITAAIAAKQSKSKHVLLVLADRDGKSYAKLTARFGIGNAGAYVLEGGTSGFSEFVKNQIASFNAQYARANTKPRCGA